MFKISKRHAAKTLTWRILGTLDTLVLSWVISNDFSLGVKIGSAELITKMLLYYTHEQIWFRSKVRQSDKRHVLKTFSWRALGTLDTILLSWLLSGNPMIGLKIGATEVITKMLLYYAHEKAWYRINYGTPRKID